MKTHKDLIVWKKSIQLVKSIYVLTNDFPKNEIYGIISQFRRAAVSIPSNIAEGAARGSTKEFIRFLYISLGSLSEIETLVIISEEIKIMPGSNINTEITEIRTMLTALIRKLSDNLKRNK